MTIDENQNIGIGVTNPSSKLDINVGGGSSALMIRHTNGLALYNEIDSGYSHLYLYQIGGGAKVVLSSSGNSYFTGGNLGVGLTTPQTTFQVNGSASSLNAHFGQGTSNSSGVFGGISLGYSEAGNAAYRKVGIVAKAIGDGAARQDLHFLVDTVSDSGSAGIADSKMNINATSGNVYII